MRFRGVRNVSAVQFDLKDPLFENKPNSSVRLRLDGVGLESPGIWGGVVPEATLFLASPFNLIAKLKKYLIYK